MTSIFSPEMKLFFYHGAEMVTDFLGLYLLPIAFAMLVLRIGFNVIESFIGDDNGKLDMKDIIQAIILVIFLANFNAVMTPVRLFVNATTDGIAQAGDNLFYEGDKLETSFDKKYAEMSGAKSNDELTAGEFLTKYYMKMVNFSFMQTLFDWIIQFGLWMVRIFTEFAVFIISNLLFTMGPLAILVTIIPGIGNKMLKTWFTAWLSVKCWLITLVLLDIFYAVTVEAMFNNDMNGANAVAISSVGAEFRGTAVMIIVGVLFIALYLATPYLTGFFIDSKATTGFMSKLMSGASMVASAGTAAATGMMTGGVGAMTGGAGGALMQGGGMSNMLGGALAKGVMGGGGGGGGSGGSSLSKMMSGGE